MADNRVIIALMLLAVISVEYSILHGFRIADNIL